MEKGTTRKILVVPGTTEIGLEVLQSLRGIRGVEVLGGGWDTGYGETVGYSQYVHLPDSRDPSFLAELRDACSNLEISFVYPAHDQVIFELRRYPKIGSATVVNHPEFSIYVCRSKHRTYDLFQDLNIVPRRYWSLSEVTSFPIFVKPSEGQGSVGVRRVESMADLVNAIDESVDDQENFFNEYVVSELLHGCEVTVDCFSTPRDGLQYCGARLRTEVRGGISSYTESIESQDLNQIARKINDRLQMRGAWFFQAMKDQDGFFKVTEIATRLAGASGLRRAQGLNFAHLTLLATMEESVQILRQAGATSLRRVSTDLFLGLPSFRRIYVDYDDTIILNGSVNAELVGFLAAAKSKGIHICLISRHQGALRDELRDRNLGWLFDEVVHLLDGSSKSTFVSDGEDSIFIDDSFSERQEVAETCGVLSLDASAVRGLWRFLHDYWRI